MDRYNALAVLGDWTFYQVEGYGDGTLYAYSMNRLINDYPPKIGELYNSLEHAMASAIAEKYTGPRGAGGSGVGTAADWFMRSIGAFEPTREELIEKTIEAGIGISGQLVIETLKLGRETA